jgi:hypothetical protein
MSNISIYTGFWYDQSRSKILGATITLPIRWGNYLIATLSVLVTICAASFWTIEAFGLHQAVVGRQDVDAVDLQQEVILRNSGSAIGTIWELVKVQMAWRGRAASRLRTRTLAIAIPAFLTWLAFTAGSIFVAEVASRSYDRIHVLINPEDCGFANLDINDPNGFLPDPTIEKLSGLNFGEMFSFTERLRGDTVDARAYARSWYGNSPTSLAHNSIFPVARLSYIVNTSAPCPFFGTGICMTASKTAMIMDTGLLDSHSILGINARVQDRVEFQRTVTCAPLNVDKYARNYYNPVTASLWNIFDLGHLLTNYAGLFEDDSQLVTFAFDTVTQLNVMDYVLL